MNEINKKYFRSALLIIAGALAVYGLIIGDLWLRAREAYQEGEKYMSWHKNPELKKQALNDKFTKEKNELDQLLTKEKMTKTEHEQRIELLEFDKNEAIAESSAKYAFIWFQTAAELFSPPESRWVIKSKEMLPIAKNLWIEELKAKKIPFEEYMLE